MLILLVSYLMKAIDRLIHEYPTIPK